MPKPVKAWMVHLERGAGAAELGGTLHMGPEALVFTLPSGEEIAIEFARALTAKRIRGSPVLMVTWVRNERQTKTAFYFVKPPPLDPPDRLERPSVTDVVRGRRASPRRQRKQNVGYLTARAGALKPLLQTWASECATQIREAKRAEGQA